MPAILSKRQNFDDNENDYYNGHDYWNDWVRWLILGLIILGGIFLFIMFSCVSARRRRRAGFNAYPLTGWALGRTPPGHAPPQYYGQNNNQQGQAAPPYSATDNTTPYYQAPSQPPPTYSGEPNKDHGAYAPTGANGASPSYAPPPGPPPTQK